MSLDPRLDFKGNYVQCLKGTTKNTAICKWYKLFDQSGCICEEKYFVTGGLAIWYMKFATVNLSSSTSRCTSGGSSSVCYFHSPCILPDS
jgi:hypothetical protein